MEDTPIEIVIKNLHRRGLYSASWFFRYSDKYGRVRLAEHEAFFAFPFEFVTVHFNEVLSNVPSVSVNSLFPFKTPSESQSPCIL
jgi:hypothetical protein